MSTIDVTNEPLRPEQITASVRRDTNGAVVTFLGTTRDRTDDRKVLYLEYESYRPMADRELARIAGEMEDRWPRAAVAIAHRLGRLEVGEISLVVAVASPHRADAYSASQFAVDRIKQTVPIWKKEFFEDGEVWVGMPEGEAAGRSSRMAARAD